MDARALVESGLEKHEVDYSRDDEIVDLIYAAVSTQNFADWHVEEFEDHISGDDTEPGGQFKSHEESLAAIKASIKRLFKVRGF